MIDMSVFLGILAGAASMYVFEEIVRALRGETKLEQKLSRCAIKAARMSANNELNSVPDDEIISRILNGGADSEPKS